VAAKRLTNYGATLNAKLEGGAAYKRHIKEIEKRLGDKVTVFVGFLDTATYPSVHGIRGTKRTEKSVAQVAFWNEFGTKRSPPRPFFRNMVTSKSPRWGIGLGAALRRTNYDSVQSLRIMGEAIQGQLVESIKQFKTPPNSPRTAAIKGFNKPLIDEAIMIRSVDFQVTSERDVF
jgi:hypothetical protein